MIIIFIILLSLSFIIGLGAVIILRQKQELNHTLMSIERQKALLRAKGIKI